MLWVKFESIYTETDRYGNQRKLENRFEAAGSGHEVCMVLENLMNRVQLPGIKPLGIPSDIEKYLLSK